MNYTIKKLLIAFHIVCGILLAINLLASYIGPFKLNFAYSQIIKYLFLISGGILFFVVKKLKAYFSVYTFSPLVILVSFLFGLAGLFVVSVMAAFIWPKSIIAESNAYILYAKFSRFMQVPDEFELTERKYFIFEKKLTEFVNTDNNENLKDSEINVKSDTAQIRFIIHDHDYESNVTTKIDTVIKIKID